MLPVLTSQKAFYYSRTYGTFFSAPKLAGFLDQIEWSLRPWFYSSIYCCFSAVNAAGFVVFFLGGLVPKIFWVESPKNGVPNRISYQNFQLESPKRKVESPMFFKKFSWESSVCFVKMVLDIIFRFLWTHLSSPYHIRHLSEVESDIWKKTFSYSKMVFQNNIYTSP